MPGRGSPAVVQDGCDDTQPATIKPVITTAVALSIVVHTDEHSIYARLPAWGYQHNTVCHPRGEYARDKDESGFCELHGRAIG